MNQKQLLAPMAAKVSDAPDSWAGMEIFWLNRSEKHNVTWLSSRMVTKVTRIEHIRSNKVLKSEFAVTVAGRVCPSTFTLNEKRLRESIPKHQALAVIDKVLSEGKFVGKLESYEAIRNRIEAADDPVIL